MTFEQYCEQREETDDPEGDFAHDVSIDYRFPKENRWPVIRRHIKRQAGFGMVDVVLEAGLNVWFEYRRKYPDHPVK